MFLSDWYFELTPNLVTKPTLPCDTGLYGLGQQMQQGKAPQVPMQRPKVSTVVGLSASDRAHF
jgi:hypothetical protein